MAKQNQPKANVNLNLDPVIERKARAIDEMSKAVFFERAATHGSSEDSFDTIAKMWSLYTGYKFSAMDVAVMMMLLKVARIKNTPKFRDHWIDLAGYGICGAGIAERESLIDAMALAPSLFKPKRGRPRKVKG